MTAHTPGPWKLEPDSNVIRSEANTWSVAELSDDNPAGLTEQRANGRLIAAAPELLEALRELVAEFDTRSEAEEFGINETGGITFARIVIAKARGEA